MEEYGGVQSVARAIIAFNHYVTSRTTLRVNGFIIWRLFGSMIACTNSKVAVLQVARNSSA